MYEAPKMNHWNMPPNSFLVSDIHEKLPNNLSKMSKPFQMSEKSEVLFLFPSGLQLVC